MVKVLILALGVLSAATPSRAGDACAAPVRDAIVSALRTRVGDGLDVRVDDLSCETEGRAVDRIVASPVPGSRFGGQMRFLLSAARERTRIGEAVAHVTATAPVVKVSRDIARAAALDAADLEETRSSLDGQLIQPLPLLPALTGAKTTRAMAAGTVITNDAVAGATAVRAGDHVRAIYRSAGMEVALVAVAAESGPVHRVIRVVNPQTRRAMRARVLGQGEVEVIDAR